MRWGFGRRDVQPLCPECTCEYEVTGKELLYAGSQPAGYAEGPLETINYVGCHDGEVLFDQLIMKAAHQVGGRRQGCGAGW